MSRNLLYSISILFASLFFVLMVGGKIPYLILHVMILYLSIPLLHNLIGLISISGSVSVNSGEFFPGDEVRISYVIKNKSHLPLPILVFNPDLTMNIEGKVLEAIPFSLKSKDAFTKTERTTLRRRGSYKVGGFHVTIKDVFGLYTFNKYIQSDISLLIYPEISTLNDFLIPVGMQSGELYVSDYSYRDKSRISNLREYRQGDSKRSIHWKASSKKDTPIVKEFETRGDTTVELFIDSFGPNFKSDSDRKVEDKLIEAATSIVNFYLLRNISLAVNYENDNTYFRLEGREYIDLKSFLRAFAMYSATGRNELSQLMESKEDRFRKGSITVLLTGNLDPKNASVAMDLAYRRLNPIVVYISNVGDSKPQEKRQFVSRLREDDIPVFVLDPKKGVSEILEVHHD